MKCCILYLFLRAELSVYLGCEESVPACSTSSIKVSPSSGHMTSDGKIFRKYYQKLFHRLLAATASSHQNLTRGRSRAWPAWFRKTNFLKIPPTGNIRGWVAQLKISRPDSLPAPPCFIKITGLSLEPPRQIIIIFLATIQRQFWCDEKIFRAAILEIIWDSPSYCRKTHTRICYDNIGNIFIQMFTTVSRLLCLLVFTMIAVIIYYTTQLECRFKIATLLWRMRNHL